MKIHCNPAPFTDTDTKYPTQNTETKSVSLVVYMRSVKLCSQLAEHGRTRQDSLVHHTAFHMIYTIMLIVLSFKSCSNRAKENPLKKTSNSHSYKFEVRDGT